MNLTVEQQNAIRCVVKDVKQGDKQVITFSGFAGTGKTTCITFLSQVLDNFAICAYTGKAANVLRKKGMHATTIHSLIYRPEPWGGKVEFSLIPPDEFNAAGFIVDEASMVSQDIYNDLLTFNKPIIYVGDHGQLEPIGSDVNVMANPMYRLEKVHRNAGEIAHFAEHIRHGKSASRFHGTEKVEILSPNSVNNDHLVGMDQIICAFNKFRVGTNKTVRNLLKFEDELLMPGERIMCLRNNKNIGLFNGMQGTVKSVDLEHCRMDFQWDEQTFPNLWFDDSQFHREKPDFAWGRDTPHPFEYAYCITAHKSQGDEWQKVMVYEQICDKWDHKRWAYTSASRAKEKLFWVTQKKFIPTSWN